MKDERNFIRIEPKTREEKLNHLISILEYVEQLEDETRFNMLLWGDVWSNTRKEFCGDVIGWACTDPVFNKMGLLLSNNSPLFNGKYHGFDAVKEFFGISSLESMFLADPATYKKDYFSTSSFFSQCVKDGIVNDSDFTLQSSLLSSLSSTDITPRMVINRIKYIIQNPISDKAI